MKDWIIKKLGGYTASEVDYVLTAFDDYTAKVDEAVKVYTDLVKSNHTWNGATKVSGVHVMPLSNEVH